MSRPWYTPVIVTYSRWRHSPRRDEKWAATLSARPGSPTSITNGATSSGPTPRWYWRTPARGVLGRRSPRVGALIFLFTEPASLVVLWWFPAS
jgi:hypothetical protein